MQEKKTKKTKIIIAVLAILLAVSISALAGTLILQYVTGHESASVEVPGNIITPDEDDTPDIDTESALAESSGIANAESTSVSNTSKTSKPTEAKTTTPVGDTQASALALHNKQAQDNTPFQVTNMFPGDAETKYYRVKVSYKGDIVVRFHADIRPEYEKLSEVLKVKIRLLDDNTTANDGLSEDIILYDGLMRDMPESLNHSLYTNEKTQSELYYEITAYLETSVGNEYMDKELIADFNWWVQEVNNLDSPETGNYINIYLWICLATGSLLVLVILFAKRRKEATDEIEKENI